jgi:hypothetical protein
MRFRELPPLERFGELAKFVEGIGFSSWVVATAPIKENSIDRLRARRQGLDQGGCKLAIISAALYAEATEHRIDKGLFETATPSGELFRESRAFRD